jgi:hypothetical protein
LKSPYFFQFVKKFLVFIERKILLAFHKSQLLACILVHLNLILTSILYLPYYHEYKAIFHHIMFVRKEGSLIFGSLRMKMKRMIMIISNC